MVLESRHLFKGALVKECEYNSVYKNASKKEDFNKVLDFSCFFKEN